MTQKKRSLLIIVASDDIEESELNNISAQAELYDIAVLREDLIKSEDLSTALEKHKEIDYIYLATHGCEDSMGNISGSLTISWADFASSICESQILSEETIFMHSCCRGGLNQVAWRMFYECNKIQFVCGPRSNIISADLLIAFNLFLYNIEMKRIDPVAAAKKVELATDVRLVCFDRIEETSTYGYQHFSDNENERYWREHDEATTAEVANELLQENPIKEN